MPVFLHIARCKPLVALSPACTGVEGGTETEGGVCLLRDFPTGAAEWSWVILK